MKILYSCCVMIKAAHMNAATLPGIGVLDAVSRHGFTALRNLG